MAFERARLRALAAVVAASVLIPVALARATPSARTLVPVESFLPPWGGAELPELPVGTNSVAVKLQDTPIYQIPGDFRQRRGLVTQRARLPVFALREASSCAGPWLMVGASAWICADRVTFEPDEPILDMSFAARPDGLPYAYYFVGVEGSASYTELAGAGSDAPAQELERGWAVPIVEQVRRDRQLWGRTRRNKWISMSDLGMAQALSFQGAAVEGELAAALAARETPGALPVGWVNQERITEYASANGGKPQGVLYRFQQMTIWQEKRAGIGNACRISPALAAERWVRCADLARPSFALPPPEVGGPAAQEKWIDVDLATQTLIAYEGVKPVFATLVSTGKGGPGSATATPRGTHRIWVKIVAQTMDNLENVDAEHHYSIEDVPWVQFFNKGVALHAAFWHKNFGRVQSHGCVNLAPIDARRLFDWTGPHLPSGYSAAYPTSFDAGTAIRVR